MRFEKKSPMTFTIMPPIENIPKTMKYVIC